MLWQAALVCTDPVAVRLVVVLCCCSVPAGLQDAKDERVTDLHSLEVKPDGSLMWSSCDSPAPSKQMPQGVHQPAGPASSVRGSWQKASAWVWCIGSIELSAAPENMRVCLVALHLHLLA